MSVDMDEDVVATLEAASLLVPERAATGNDIAVTDVWDHLANDEWEVALDLLQELGGAWTAPPGFWEGHVRVCCGWWQRDDPGGVPPGHAAPVARRHACAYARTSGRCPSSRRQART